VLCVIPLHSVHCSSPVRSGGGVDIRYHTAADIPCVHFCGL